LAALAVAWFHITHGGKLIADSKFFIVQLASSIGAVGYHGITLFFILSGFVIPWSIRHVAPVDGLNGAVRGLPIFVLRRLLRLQPPFFVACVLAIALNVLSSVMPGYQGSFSVSLSQAVTALLTDNLYLTGLLGGTWILVVAWTLALEVQFYVVAGLIEPWFRSKQGERPLLIFYGLGMVLVTTLAFLIPQPTFVFRVLPVFALGWVTAHHASKPLPVHWFALAWLLILITRLSGLEHVVVAACCLALLKLALIFPSFSPAPMIWLGNISYSLFLTHVPIGGRVVNLLSRWSDSPLLLFLVCLLAVVVSALFGWGFYVLIEKPSHRFSRRVLLPV
jgi:peptidoglycan/LPS O-acetylase OafA/YrhL